MLVVKLLFVLAAILSAGLVLWQGVAGLIAVAFVLVGSTAIVALVVGVTTAVRGEP